jgi:hypothetical protein
VVASGAAQVVQEDGSSGMARDSFTLRSPGIVESRSLCPWASRMSNAVPT